MVGVGGDDDSGRGRCRCHVDQRLFPSPLFPPPSMKNIRTCAICESHQLLKQATS